MLTTILLSGVFYGLAPADSQHFRFDHRIDRDRIETIKLVNPYFDENYEALLLEAEAARKIKARQAKIAARKRREAALKRAAAQGNLILAGVVNLKRLEETGPIDGCKKINKGLIMGGGFMLFTCEKLLPNHPISKHETVFKKYSAALLKDKWRKMPESIEGDIKFVRSDGLGCEANLNLRLWTDRSMNEPPRPASERNAHRQIVFMAKFYGKSCERYYPVVEALAAQK